MKKPLISVIIPVYNNEQYIEQCINSITRQTYQNLEVLCIYDENSTDNVLNILRNLEKNDNRIKVFLTNSKNVGASRNIGINNANGLYMCFLDSDDWVDPKYIDILYNEMATGQYDLVMCSSLLYNNKTFKFYEDQYYTHSFFHNMYSENNSFTKDAILKYMIQVEVGPCNKLFKTNIIKKHNINNTEDIIFEDNIFFFKYIINCSLPIKFVNNFLVYYRTHTKKSLTNQVDKFLDIFKMLKVLENIFKEYNIHEKYKIQLKEYKTVSIMHWLYGRGFIANKKYFELMSEEINNDKIFVDKKLKKLSKKGNNSLYRHFFYKNKISPLIKEFLNNKIVGIFSPFIKDLFYLIYNIPLSIIICFLVIFKVLIFLLKTKKFN